MLQSRDENCPHVTDDLGRDLRNLFQASPLSVCPPLPRGSIAFTGLSEAELNRTCYSLDALPTDFALALRKLRHHAHGGLIDVVASNEAARQQLALASAVPAGPLLFLRLKISLAGAGATATNRVAVLGVKDMPLARNLVAGCDSLLENDCRLAWPAKVLASGEVELLAWDMGGQLVAGGRLVRTGGHVSTLFVGTRADYRGRDVGSALMLGPIEPYRAHGAEAMSLMTSNSKADFYLRLGFEAAMERWLYSINASAHNSSNSKHLEEYT